MDVRGQALGLVDLLYDAATDPGRWPVFLERLADALGASTAALVSHDFEAHDGGTSCAVRLDPNAARQYNEYYARHDPWARSLSLFGVGQLAVGQLIAPPAVLRRTEFYNEFGRTYGVVWMMGLPLACRGRTVPTFLSALRGDQREPFDAHDAALMRTIAPHACRAVEIQRHLRTADREHGSATDALDYLAIGVVLLASSGRVIFVNQAASRIVAQRDGLSVDRMLLRPARPTEAIELEHLIAGAANTIDAEGFDSGGAMRISRPSGRRAYEILAAPLRWPDSKCWPVQSSVAVFVSDPDARGLMPIDRWRQRYHLTVAESEIAAALVAGHSAGEIAGLRGIRPSTARWFIKQVLHKIGARTHSEAVRLLCRASDANGTRGGAEPTRGVPVGEGIR